MIDNSIVMINHSKSHISQFCFCFKYELIGHSCNYLNQPMHFYWRYIYRNYEEQLVFYLTKIQFSCVKNSKMCNCCNTSVVQDLISIS